jgi:HEAT repeat protein
VPGIVRVLRQSGPGSGVALSLGQIGPDSATAVPPLVQSLNDANPSTRSEIETALDRIMPRDRTATIAGSIAALKADAPTGRTRAAYDLGWLIEKPSPSAAAGVAALGRALDDPDPLVRRMATAVLGRLGPRAAPAGPALLRATRDPDEWVRELAARGLGGLAAEMPGSIPALAEMMTDPSGGVRRRAARVLGSLGPRAAPAALAMIAGLEGQDIPTRAAILTAASRVDAAGGAVVPTFLAALDDPSDQIRTAAAEALGRFIGSHRNVVVPALLKAMKDPSRLVRDEVSRSLGASRPARLVLSPLIERLGDGDPIVRVAATEALSRMADTPEREAETTRRVVEALGAALADPDRRVRSGAAWGLARFGDEAAAAEPTLRAAMDDPSRVVRDGASAALRAIAEGRGRR